MDQRDPRLMGHTLEATLYTDGQRIRQADVPNLPDVLQPRRADMDQPGMLGTQLPPIVAMEDGDLAYDRLFRVRGVPELDAGQNSSANPIAVVMPDDGYVVGMMGTTRANGGVLAQGAMEFRVTVGDEQGSLATQGLFGTWMPLTMFGTLYYRFLRLTRRVVNKEQWLFEFRNISAIDNLTADITMGFRSLRTCGQIVTPPIIGVDLAPSRMAPVIVQSTGCDRIVRVMRQNGSPLQEIGAATIGPTTSWNWPEDGYVTHILAMPALQCLPVGQTSLALQLEMGDSGTQWVTDGQSADYTLLSVFGLGAPAWIPLFRAVTREIAWSATFRNFHPDTAFTPNLLFRFRSAKSLAGLR